MLALSATLSLSVQLPKLAAYRASASNLASSHIERIRANPQGFAANAYSSALSYDGTRASISLNDCLYPLCTPASLAAMDNAALKHATRAELPMGGMLMKCDTAICTSGSYGDLWIVWQEPPTFAPLDPGNSDHCPIDFAAPKPRCLYVRFKP